MSKQKMHAHEIEIEPTLIGNLIKAQCPEWKHLPIQRIASPGTDNAIFRLGDDKCIRMPRIPESVDHVEAEHRFLPGFAGALPLAIPKVICKGGPGCGYPWPWSIFEWIEGSNAFVTPIADLDQAAIDLAHFLRALWQIDATDGPTAPRGRPLSQRDEETKQAISALANVLDMKAVSAIWQHCLNAPVWPHAPMWFHGDLLPANLLVRDGRIVAVIDFDLMGVGDPAIDMLPAWSLLDSSSRKTFRRALAIDDATWVRGCGWALTVSLTILPYYQDTNPTLTAIAHRMIREILNGEDVFSKI